jgi:transposase
MSQTKEDFLKSEGLLNRKHERVKHPLFQTLDFFDPMDLPQVKYELLRATRVDRISVVQVCRLFGFSREYFYRLEKAFMSRGYVALIGSPMGRRPILALNHEIVGFIVHRKMDKPTLSGESLRKEILDRYSVDCSRRTVERIVQKLGLGKKGRHRA